MIEKGSLNFFTQFYSLLLIQEHVYLTLEKYCLLYLELVEVQTEQIFDRHCTKNKVFY